MGYIYKITNKVNNKVYIGQTIRTVEERYQRHLSEAKRRTNRPLYDSMNHYGIGNFMVETIVEADNAKLNELEAFYISEYNSTDRAVGYNLTTGGDSCRVCLSEEAEAKRVAKIVAAHLGTKQSRETIEKRVAKVRGRKCSEDAKQRMSEAQKERFKYSPGTRLGAVTTDEMKQKLREANLGKKQSEETKLKRKESISKLKWWNNGVQNLRAEGCPEGYVAGRINFKPSAESKAKSSHKGTKWFTNGKENKMAYECPDGFWPGKTFKKDLIK